MKIVYVSTARVPDEWAHVTQILKTCDAFARAGNDVELVVPKRLRTRDTDPYEAARIGRTFPIRRLPALDLMGLPFPRAFNLLVFTYFLSLRSYLASAPEGTVLYVRGELAVPLAAAFGKRFRIIWETHERPGNEEAYKKILPRLAGIVTITRIYKEELTRDWGVPGEKVMVAPDAVELADFEHPESKAAARARLGIESGAKVAMYIGLLDAWKGVATLYAAGEELAPHIETVIIGGFGEEKAAQAAHPTLCFLGFRPYAELAGNQQAADALILPNSGKMAVSAKYTSPLKLFTYMASGVPIIASDLPSLREILSEANAVLIPPDDPAALSAAIRAVIERPEEYAPRAARAKEDVRRYTWDARASAILGFAKGLS